MDTVVERKAYKTLGMSDLHLGTKFSKVNEVCEFLSRVSMLQFSSLTA